jgi:hypothetical protein
MSFGSAGGRANSPDASIAAQAAPQGAEPAQASIDGPPARNNGTKERTPLSPASIGRVAAMSRQQNAAASRLATQRRG